MSGVSRCTRCLRPAVVNAVGSFRNGRPAIDPRCAAHCPTDADFGCYLILEGTETRTHPPLQYRLDELRPITPSAVPV